MHLAVARTGSRNRQPGRIGLRLLFSGLLVDAGLFAGVRTAENGSEEIPGLDDDPLIGSQGPHDRTAYEVHHRIPRS